MPFDSQPFDDIIREANDTTLIEEAEYHLSRTRRAIVRLDTALTRYRETRQW